MKSISAFLALAILSQPLMASEGTARYGASDSAARSSLVQHLMGDAKAGADANVRRERIQQELALQDKILAEADRLGLAKRSDVEARIELSRRRVIVDSYWEDFFSKNPVKEDAIKARYRELSQANGNMQYRLSQIFVKDDAAARQVLDALSRKKSFADVAKDMSQDPATRSSGGDLGWRWKTEVIPEMARLLDFLKPGEYTRQPIITPAGVLIVRVDESRKQDFPSFDKIRPELENALRVQAQQIELARIQAQSR